MKYTHPLALLTLLFSVSCLAEPAMDKVALGKLIFHDENLSEPAGQSCNSCHDSQQLYADPGKVVSPGANPELFGNRNAPMISYVKFNPDLYWDTEEEHWVGGLFLDGRAKTLQDQAGKPFLNPLEMANANPEQVVSKVRKAAYSKMFEQIYGQQIWQNTDNSFSAIRDALVAYQKGPEFAVFTSKYDYYLQGKVELNPMELKGLELFEAEDKGNCAACHPSQKPDNEAMPLLTDFTYDNLGLPPVPELPFLAMDKTYNPDGSAWKDTGLKNNPHIHNATEETGKFKVPTLRNIAESGPYMHNGIFESLKEVVEFYNSRDTKEGKERWGEPEILQNVNNEELGDLGLNEEEIEAIVAFMKTLTDGYELNQTR